MDGRDIATVVFPEAELKIFLDALPQQELRARIKNLPPREMRFLAGCLEKCCGERSYRFYP